MLLPIGRKRLIVFLLILLNVELVELQSNDANSSLDDPFELTPDLSDGLNKLGVGVGPHVIGASGAGWVC
jgi:hypothetical protein